MKKITAIVLVFTVMFMIFSVAAVQAAQLNSGTLINCRLLNDLRSSDNNIGRVDFRVTQDVIGPDGRVAIPAGSTGFGTLSVKPAGGCGSSGYLVFSSTALNVNGRSIPVDFSMRKDGTSNAGWVIPVSIVAGLLTGIGFFLLFIQGGDAVIPAGTQFDVTLDSNYSY